MSSARPFGRLPYSTDHDPRFLASSSIVVDRFGGSGRSSLRKAIIAATEPRRAAAHNRPSSSSLVIGSAVWTGSGSAYRGAREGQQVSPQ